MQDDKEMDCNENSDSRHLSLSCPSTDAPSSSSQCTDNSIRCGTDFETPKKSGNPSDLCAVCLSPLIVKRRLQNPEDNENDMEEENDLAITKCQVAILSH